jgi:hypothetical protein
MGGGEGLYSLVTNNKVIMKIKGLTNKALIKINDLRI